MEHLTPQQVADWVADSGRAAPLLLDVREPWEFEKASIAELGPHKLDNTLAFMLESRYRFVPTAYAMEGGALDASYSQCWAGLQDRFEA